MSNDCRLGYPPAADRMFGEMPSYFHVPRYPLGVPRRFHDAVARGVAAYRAQSLSRRLAIKVDFECMTASDTLRAPVCDPKIVAADQHACQQQMRLQGLGP